MKAIGKFVGLGAVTTVASYATYLIALEFVLPMTAYFLGLAASFTVQTAMMAPFVYNEKLTVRSAGKSLVIYAGYSAIFASLMWTSLQLGIPAVIAPLVVVAVAAPLQFFAGKKWLHNPEEDIRN